MQNLVQSGKPLQWHDNPYRFFLQKRYGNPTMQNLVRSGKPFRWRDNPHCYFLQKRYGNPVPQASFACGGRFA
jgi:hypothetical protein